MKDLKVGYWATYFTGTLREQDESECIGVISRFTKKMVVITVMGERNWMARDDSERYLPLHEHDQYEKRYNKDSWRLMETYKDNPNMIQQSFNY